MRVFLCNRKFLGIPYYTKRHILFYRRFRPSTYVESIQILRFSPDFWRSKQAFCTLGLTNFAELFSYNIPCRTERWEETVTYRVYADVILLQNLAADFLLLSVVKNCLRLPERRYGRLAGSLLGAVYALGMVLAPVPLGYAGRMLLNATMSVLMAWTAFSIRRKSEAAEAAIGLYIASMLAAGCMELVQPLGIRVNLLFWLFTAGGSFLIPSAVWRFGMQRCMKLEHQYAVTLFNKGRERHVQAILDTGNHLTMPLSGRPVQVLDACAAERFFSWEDGVQYIPFRSVGKGGGVIPAYQAERMEVSGQGGMRVIEKPWIAISQEALSQKGEYQMLLNEKYWL